MWIYPFKRKETSLPQVVDNDLELVFPPENIFVELKLAQDLLLVKVDAGQVEQVLINLITNAYQAMPDGSELAIFGIQNNGQGKFGG